MSDTSQSPGERSRRGPQPLPGPTSVQIMFRAIPLALGAFICTLALGFQAYVPWQTSWVVAFLTLGLVFVGLFVRNLFKVKKRDKEEAVRGYTTVWYIAQERPDLWLLYDKTLEVLSAPGEPRPKNMRAATVRAWHAE